MSSKHNNCNICGKVFALKSSLKIHLVKHRNITTKCVTSDVAEVTDENAKITSANTCGDKNEVNNSENENVVKLSSEKVEKIVKVNIANEPAKGDEGNTSAKGNKVSNFVTQNEEDELNTEKDLIDLAGAFVIKSEKVGLIDENEQDELITSKENGISDIPNAIDESYDEFENGIISAGNSHFQYECNLCGKEFGSVPCLTRHMHKHTSKGSRKCLLCPKTFAKRNGLEAHMARHSLRESQHCKVCKKQFGYTDSFKKHEAIILAKIHQCKICKGVFCSRALLMAHKPQCKLDKENERKARQVCSSCKTGFASEDMLQEHKKMESYSCNVCQILFQSCGELKSHTSSHDIACLKCSITFTSKEELKDHNKIHVEEELTCPICKRRFTNKHSVPVHVRRVHGGIKDVQCETCGKMLTRSAYKNHLRVHTGERPFGCDECGASFTQRAHLRAHLKYHRGIKDFHCDICERSFAAKQTLNIHRRTHTGEKPYACLHCPKTFVHTTTFRLHMMQHNPNDYHPCTLCSKVFSKSSILNEHYRQHSEEALAALDPETLKVIMDWECNSCQICDKSFKTRHMLHIHYSEHSDDDLKKLDTRTQSFIRKLKVTTPVCKLCGKMFLQYSALRGHMRLHTGQKPYICDLCGKAFRMKMMLANHRRIHTGERPYKCELCDKSFMQRAHAKSHILTHTGVKPHACTICGKTFAHNGNRKVHEKTHVKNWDSNSLEKPTYMCALCGREFTNKYKYENHINYCANTKQEVVEMDSFSSESYHSGSYMSGEEESIVHFSERESIKIENTYGEESIETPSISVVTPVNPSSESLIIIRIGKRLPIKEEIVINVDASDMQ